MTGKLWRGTKHKSISPRPMDTERDKKRKESEPNIDTSGIENERSQTESDEDTATSKRWMTEAMKQLKERMDDVSEVERSLTKVKIDMANMNDNLSKVADAITKMTEDNNARDHKFEKLMKGTSNGIQERDRKMDKKSSKGWKKD